MDVLKDKSKKSYPYISRYAAFPFYYHTKDDKYIYGITSQLSDDVSFVIHEITESDTLDSLADKYYGRPDLFWVIADFNKIQDPFIKLFGKYETLKVPSLSNITFKQQ